MAAERQQNAPPSDVGIGPARRDPSGLVECGERLLAPAELGQSRAPPIVGIGPARRDPSGLVECGERLLAPAKIDERRAPPTVGIGRRVVDAQRRVVLGKGIARVAGIAKDMAAHDPRGRGVGVDADRLAEVRERPLDAAASAVRDPQPHVRLGAAGLGRDGRLQVARRPAGPREAQEYDAAQDKERGAAARPPWRPVERGERLFVAAEAVEGRGAAFVAAWTLGAEPHRLAVRGERLFVAAEDGQNASESPVPAGALWFQPHRLAVRGERLFVAALVGQGRGALRVRVGVFQVRPRRPVARLGRLAGVALFHGPVPLPAAPCTPSSPPLPTPSPRTGAGPTARDLCRAACGRRRGRRQAGPRPPAPARLDLRGGPGWAGEDANTGQSAERAAPADTA